MKTRADMPAAGAVEEGEGVRPVGYDFGLSRRAFVQRLATGVLLTIQVPGVLGQRSRGGGGQPVSARIHLGKDGVVTVLTGKIEMGQGARAQLTQAAAEELRVAAGQVRMEMGDTGLVPDDGITAGSRTTPSTVPAVRQGAAAARELLRAIAAAGWDVAVEAVEVRDGRITHRGSQRSMSYGELAGGEAVTEAFARRVSGEAVLTPVGEWQVMGKSVARPNARELVTGAHQFPSDYTRPGMLYGKVLRPPEYGAKLTAVDLGGGEAMAGVVVVRDGSFVGVAASTTHRARQALEAIALTARWEPTSQPSSREIYDHLRWRADGGVPRSPYTEELGRAGSVLRESWIARICPRWAAVRRRSLRLHRR